MNKKHNQYKHGMYGTRPYRIWVGMKKRCNNPKSNNYERYGGLGVRVCERWDKFINFWEDMQEGYRDDLTIDRIDSKGDYIPENCKWSTPKEQVDNRGYTTFYEYNGERMSGRDWDRKLGFKLGTVRFRVKEQNWSVEEAITTPIKVYKDAGIAWCSSRKKWRAYASVKGKRYNVGRFSTKQEAKDARCNFLAELLELK